MPPIAPPAPRTLRLWPRAGVARQAALAIAGTLVLVASAKLQVPFWPVPVTMQSLAVLLIGLAYGPRLGALTVGLYLAEGLVGLPVFAGPLAGPAYLAGPTGGYLAGFLLAVVATGHLAARGWAGTWLRSAALLALGHALIIGAGVGWLAVSFGWAGAIAAGLTPFVLGTVVKTALGTALIGAVRPR